MTTYGVALPCFGPLADPVAVRDLVQEAEALGFADVWFGDHVAIPAYAAHLTSPEWLDPLTLASTVLGATSRIRVGTDVLVLPLRHPLLVARMAASADVLSGGRFVLGVGVGYLRGEFEAVGVPYAARGAVTDEHLEVLERLWASEGAPVSHEGEHVRFADVMAGPAPADGRVPTWVGGNGPRAQRRAARFGDGWHPLFPDVAAYAAGRSAILAQREAAGADRPFTFSLSLATTQLMAAAPPTFDTRTWDDVPDDFHYAPAPPTAEGGRPMFVGTPDQVVADVAAYAAVGVEHVTLRFSHGGPDVGVAEVLAQMRWFAADVLPATA